MTQLDFTIINYESLNIILIIVGYFYVTKNIISILGFNLKIKNNLELFLFLKISQDNSIIYNIQDICNYIIKIIFIYYNILLANNILYGISKLDMLYLNYIEE